MSPLKIGNVVPQVRRLLKLQRYSKFKHKLFHAVDGLAKIRWRIRNIARHRPRHRTAARPVTFTSMLSARVDPVNDLGDPFLDTGRLNAVKNIIGLLFFSPSFRLIDRILHGSGNHIREEYRFAVDVPGRPSNSLN